MGIFDSLRTKADIAPAAAPTNLQQVDLDKQLNGAAPANVNVQDPANVVTGVQLPGSPANQPAPNPPQSPLDDFLRLIDTKKQVDPNAKEPVSLDISLPAEDLKKIADGIDFTKVISQEDMEGLTTGDSNAILNALQAVSRETYQTALQHFAALSNQNLNTRMEALPEVFNERISSALTKQTIDSSLMDNTHPLVKREVERIAQTLKQANPAATASEIATASKQYITELAKGLQEVTQTEPKASEATFDNWLDGK